MTTTLGYDPIKLARYILAKQGSISNMKLQKLLFYTDSIFLAATNKSLFKEEFEAWKHGPVLPSVYHEFKKYSVLRTNIPYTREALDDDLNLPEDQLTIVDKVIEVFGKHNEDVLRNKTHADQPYKIARAGVPEGANSNAKMEKTQLKKYYRAKLVQTKNPRLQEINQQMKRNIMLSIADKYDDAWVELAK